MRTLMQACSGIAEFGADGRAQVRVPTWFSPGEGKLHYQLTCVGGFAPVFVEDELRDSELTIGGGKRGIKVCWQISLVPRAVELKAVAAGTLPPRVRETLEILMTGASNKEIATRLDISQNTVHQYVKVLLRAYGVSGSSELVARLLSSCSCGHGSGPSDNR